MSFLSVMLEQNRDLLPRQLHLVPFCDYFKQLMNKYELFPDNLSWLTVQI